MSEHQTMETDLTLCNPVKMGLLRRDASCNNSRAFNQTFPKILGGARQIVGHVICSGHRDLELQTLSILKR